MTAIGQTGRMNTETTGHVLASKALSRRGFLQAGGALSLLTALAACGPHPTSTASAPTAEGTSSAPAPGRSTDRPAPQAGLPHALRRLTFGPTPDLTAEAQALGLTAWLEAQLAPDRAPGAEVETRLAALTTLSMSPAERAALEPKGQAAQELVAATLVQLRHSDRQVYEMLVDFWSNHFNIHLAGQPEIFLKTDDDLNVIRPNALATFADLLTASAHSPAMLAYLNQAESTRAAPNENYARELLELHSVGVDGGYTQDDVESLARVLTGWSIVGPRRRSPALDGGRFVFRPEDHDDSVAQVLGLSIPAGAGRQGGEDVLAYLAKQPATARFIASKLARRFVADDPPAALIDTLAAVFSTTGGEVPALMRALVAAPEFAASAWSKLKRPLEFVISALRVTDAATEQPRSIAAVLRGLGQLPFGWEAPNGYPDAAPFWQTTSGVLGRWNFALDLTANRVRGTRVDLAALTRDAGSPEDVVDVLALRFVGEPLSSEARAILVDVAHGRALEQQLPLIAGLILASPYFQRR